MIFKLNPFLYNLKTLHANWHCPIHKGTFKTFVRSSMNQKSTYKILKTDDFRLWFPYKSDSRNSTAGKRIGII